ncbi:uncharacterized protein LOC126843165 [Adelges cooleyi]|uniref:uncharacterized protein LOC126843165 n=1 Tax=Adelges cooleyi TaxID=133065 RepID=UPI00217F90FB|nr:uncharacterized protein LOC126843165 [Adelges cooleyi]
MFSGARWMQSAILWLITIISLSNAASLKTNRICYICSPQQLSDNTEASEIHNMFPDIDLQSIPSCGSNEATNFTLKCPLGYKGCLTKTYGISVIKLCNEYSIEDCKVANNIEYCFCANDKCNNATVGTTVPILSDDEDLDQAIEDGSGLFDNWTESNKKQNTANIITTSTNTENTNSNKSEAKLITPTKFIIINCIILNTILTISFLNN